jgi:integrase
VDLQTGVLHVRQRADRFNRLGPPKSRAGRRTVPLAPMVINTLKEWKLTCPRTDLDLVFPSEKGGIIWHGNLYLRGWRVLLDHCDLAGTKDGQRPYTFHSLRHAAVSLMIETGWPPKKVQEIIGHGSIQMTLDTYGHLWPTPDDDRAAMARLEARLLS